MTYVIREEKVSRITKLFVWKSGDENENEEKQRTSFMDGS